MRSVPGAEVRRGTREVRLGLGSTKQTGRINTKVSKKVSGVKEGMRHIEERFLKEFSFVYSYIKWFLKR